MHPVGGKSCEEDKNNQRNKIKKVFRSIFPKIKTDRLLAPKGSSVFQVSRNENRINLKKLGASNKCLFKKNTSIIVSKCQNKTIEPIKINNLTYPANQLNTYNTLTVEKVQMKKIAVNDSEIICTEVEKEKELSNLYEARSLSNVEEKKKELSSITEAGSLSTEADKEELNENETVKILTIAHKDTEELNIKGAIKIFAVSESENSASNTFDKTETEKQTFHKNKAYKNGLVCTQCPYVGRDKFNLQRHLKKHSEPAVSQEKKADNIIGAKTTIKKLNENKDNKNKISCKFCSYVGRDNFNLQRHEKKHRKDEDNIQKCHYCEYWCKKNYLRYHEKLHLNS
jgi:hypothetical protein